MLELSHCEPLPACACIMLPRSGDGRRNCMHMDQSISPHIIRDVSRRITSSGHSRNPMVSSFTYYHEIEVAFDSVIQYVNGIYSV